jgi:cytochrome c peroxidase
VTCHQAPEFTDFKFHNTGAAQEEYDTVHGEGSFAKLQIPSFMERRKRPDRFLPPTPQHPKALGVFRLPASQSDAQAADLGLWNVFANSDFPEPQAKLEKLLCTDKACAPRLLLPRTIALFRTPSLRDLGHSAPYLHTGRKATLEDVLHFYMQRSSLTREGKLRNGDPELSSIELDEDDATAVAAFLRSLDEDYDN